MIEPKPVDRTYPEIIEALKEILDKNESVKESPWSQIHEPRLDCPVMFVPEKLK